MQSILNDQLYYEDMVFGKIFYSIFYKWWINIENCLLNNMQLCILI